MDNGQWLPPPTFENNNSRKTNRTHSFHYRLSSFPVPNATPLSLSLLRRRAIIFVALLFLAAYSPSSASDVTELAMAIEVRVASESDEPSSMPPIFLLPEPPPRPKQPTQRQQLMRRRNKRRWTPSPLTSWC